MRKRTDPSDASAVPFELVRQRAAADRRAYGLRITSLGRRRLAEMKRLVRAADRSALAALSAAERRQLFALLEKVGRAPDGVSRRGAAAAPRVPPAMKRPRS